MLRQAAAVTSPAEYLEFVELLKPVYDRQPAELDATTSWRQILANTYDRLGRTEELLALQAKAAAQAPWDVSKQTDYAERLMQAGQADAAYDWLQKQLDRKVERDNSEDESLRTAYANLYRGQVRWEDLLRFTTKWIDRKPEYQSAYLQHLSALVYNDRLDDANALALQWLKEAQIKGKLAPIKMRGSAPPSVSPKGMPTIYRSTGWMNAGSSRLLKRHDSSSTISSTFRSSRG